MFFSSYESPEAFVKSGSLDLTNLKGNDLLVLAGNWEFYPSKLYSPLQLAAKNIKPKFTYLPHIWDFDENNFPDMQGYATYRVILKNCRIDNAYGLLIPVINSSYKLWINRVLLSSQGRVARTLADSENSWQPDQISFISHSSNIEIVLQVANWGYYKGGIPFNFTLGKKQDIKSLQGRKNIFDYTSIGGLLIIALFHVGLFVLRRNDKAPLFLGLFALVVALRAMTTGENMIYFLGDWVSWDLHYRLYMASQGLMAAIFLKFISSTFSNIKSGKVFLSLIFLNLVSAFASLSFSPGFIDDKGIFLDLITLTSIFFVFTLVIKAWVQKEPGVNWFFRGFSLFMLFVMHDIIGEKTLQNSVMFLPIGFLIFVLFQSLLLSARYNKAFSLVEYYAQYLKDEVDKKTFAIKKKSDEIISSVKYAKRIQSAMFSDINLLKKHFKDFFVFSCPKGIVGGDFFWYNESKKRFILALVDCTGHGVPGAFMTLLVNNSLESLAKVDKKATAGEYLVHLNKQIKAILHKNERENVSDDGFDIALCIIEKESKELNYAGAKIPLFSCKNRVIMEYPANKKSVGYMRVPDSYKYKDYRIPFEEDTVFYLSSDGYFDQLGGDNEFPFGKRRFKDLIIDNHSKTLLKQKDLILTEHLLYRGDFEQVDDLSLIGFKL